MLNASPSVDFGHIMLSSGATFPIGANSTTFFSVMAADHEMPASAYLTRSNTYAPDFPISRRGRVMHECEASFVGTRVFDAHGREVDLPSWDDGDVTIFTMSASGRVYLTEYPINHPELLGGGAAAAAGELYHHYFEPGVRALVATDRSGHYLPWPWHMRQFLWELDDRNVPLDEVYVYLRSFGESPPRPALDLWDWMGRNPPPMSRSVEAYLHPNA